MSNVTTISGNYLNKTISGNGSDTVVNGNDNSIDLNGQSNVITLNGTANTVNLDGNSGFVTANGTGDVISILGNGNTISANGTGDVVTLEGTGLNLFVGVGGNVSLEYGTHVVISGSTENLSEVGGANLTFNGAPATLSVGGGSNVDVLNGNGQVVAIAATSQANNVTVNGQGANLVIAGGGNTVTTNGTGETLSVTGSNNSIAVNGASGNKVTISDYNNILNTAGTDVTFANSSGGTVDGGNNTVSIGSGDNVALNGSGFITSLDGNGSTATYDGAYGYLYITGASDSVTINGGDNTVTEAGSNDTLILAGLSEQISVSGTGQILEVNGATIDVAAGAKVTLATGSSNGYSDGNIIDIGASATLLVKGAGASDNWVQAASGDAVTLSGSGDGIAASGTGNNISLLNAGAVAAVNGSSLIVASGASLALTGATNTVNLAAGSSLTVTGASNAIYGGSGDVVSVSGSGNALTMNSGTINFTGSGNVTATEGTGFAVNGFAFPSDTLGAYNNAAATASLAALRATGANSVELVVTSYVANSTADGISTSSGTGLTTESDASLIAEIKQAKADGLSVFLAPHINIDDGTWSALLKPSNIAAFFANYQSFILHYAAIAQANGVTTFSIGNELSGVDGAQDLPYWKTLIAAVRTLYHGTITYNSAWNDTANVSFWSQVDEIGANAYDPVTDGITDPTLAQLESGWTSVNPLDSSVTGGVSAVQWYENLAAKYGKTVLFTEIGYQSVNGTNFLNGAIPAAGATYVDYQQQALADQALLTVLHQDQGSWFKGLYLWDWNPQPTQVQTNDFSPQGKPALAVIDAWYQGTEPATIGPQTGTLSANSNKVGLGNSVTLDLSGTGNTIVLGSGDSINASGSGNIYEFTASQLAGETIAGTGSDTLMVTTAGTLLASSFAHITGVSTIELAAGNNLLNVSDAMAAGASGATLSVIAGSTGTAVVDAVTVGAAHSVHLTAGSGAATLTGGAGADVLTAGSGTSTLSGGGGADTYVYGAGDGAATVINYTSLGVATHGQIEFASPLTDANLWLIESGTNLQIDILGSKSLLTVSDWFGTNKSAAVSEITAGGLKLDSQTSALVTAMASYQAANPGFNPQTASAMPTNTALHASIIAAWHS
jgi:hypothetical protein